jgi:hypothetical protein
MGQAAGDTEIANMALALLGSSTRLNSISQSGPVADAARTSLLFRPAELLEMHNWNFALRRQSLPVTSATPAADEEYPFMINLPPDCLRWIPWSRDDVHYFRAEREGMVLLVKDSAPQIVRYVFAVTDRTQWSALFVRALVAQVAHDLAEPVSADKSSRDRAATAFDDAMAMAKRMDGLETGRTDRPPAWRLSNAVAAMGSGVRRDPGRWHE